MAVIDSYGGKTLASRVHNTFDDHPEVKKEELHHFWLNEAHKPYPLKVTKLGFLVASFPGLPRFYLPFAFTIIHRSRRPAKNWEGLEAFITWMTSGGCNVDVGGRGPTAKTTHKIICLSTSPCFQTPDLSVMETIRLDRKETHFQYVYFWILVLPPYVHLTSTHVMNMFSGLPCFNFSPIFQLWMQTEGKNGGGLGTRLNFGALCVHLHMEHHI